MHTPVLFLIFNRPATTARVFERIRAARPTALYVAADGPRPDRDADIEGCRSARDLVINGIDWPCEVHTRFQERNLGCKQAVSSAISWFFDQVEEGVILEDDTLPDLSFFPFCEELLQRYRADERVMLISGDNMRPIPRSESYFFSRFVHIWGWATWRRAWRHYDLEMRDWPGLRRDGHWLDFLNHATAARSRKMFEVAYRGSTTTWDTQWLFACWKQNGLSVIPSVNQVSNIERYGIHMKVYDPHLEMPTRSMAFPLTHPLRIEADVLHDHYIQRYAFLRGSLQSAELVFRYLGRTLRYQPCLFGKAIRDVARNIWSEAIQRANAKKHFLMHSDPG